MTTPEVKIVQLPGHFIQVQLGGLKQIVDHHRENDARVRFDASDVERMDGAAVQFLLAVNQLQAGADSVGPLIQNANDVLAKAIDDLGVSEFLTLACPDEYSRVETV